MSYTRWTVARMIYAARGLSPDDVQQVVRRMTHASLRQNTEGLLCAFCGEREDVVFPMGLLISHEFGDILPPTEAVCAPCAYTLKDINLLGRYTHAQKRGGKPTRNRFLSPGRLVTPSDGVTYLDYHGVERAITSPPRPPFALQITLDANAWRHHLFYRTPVSYSSSPFVALVALSSSDIGLAYFIPRQAQRDLADLRRFLWGPQPGPRAAALQAKGALLGMAHELTLSAHRLGELSGATRRQLDAHATRTGLPPERIAALAGYAAFDLAGRVLLRIADTTDRRSRHHGRDATLRRTP